MGGISEMKGRNLKLASLFCGFGGEKPVKCAHRKNGEWRMSESDRKVAFGRKEPYRDYSF